jgi:hypothetical protein
VTVKRTPDCVLAGNHVLSVAGVGEGMEGTDAMTKQPRTIPDFRSEEEELRFWDQHDPSDFDDGPADVIVRLKRRPKRAVTLRIDQGLLTV